MAACGFGIPGLKFGKLNLGSAGPKLSTLQPFHGLKVQEIVLFDGLVLSHRANKGITACRVTKTEADSAAMNLEAELEETVSPEQLNPHLPNSVEVESLLNALCDTTSIAEFELKLGGFQLRVTRNFMEQRAVPQPSFPAPVTGHSVIEAPDSNGSASSPSLALTKSVTSSSGVQTLLDKAADEGLKILRSPRVGYFRRSRTIKGKRAPPACKEKDVVKEGQVLCYIEQLGGELPVESNVSGEVVKILKHDGEPVGYGDTLIAVLPSFPGIMKLQ